MPSFPVTLAFGLGLFFLSALPTTAPALPAGAPSSLTTGPLVMLDPGHGAPDSGVKAANFSEAEFTLDLAKRLAKALAARGIRASLTRDDAQGLSLSARALLANRAGADCFISLHANYSFTPASKGPRVFISASKTNVASIQDPRGGKSLALSRWTQSQSPVFNQARQIGLAIAGELEPGTGVQALRLAPFNGLLMPAVLVECGFVSQDSELEKMKSAEGRDDLARRICQGLEKYFAARAGGLP